MTTNKIRCTATTAKGQPCQAWAVPGSNPPLCAAHGGATKLPGAPQGNKNALKHGFYAHYDAPGVGIDDIIADLAAKQAALSQYLDEKLTPDVDLAGLTGLFELHAQTASRLGRLLRDRRALSGEASDGISGAIAQALDELATELQTDL
jgi:hypothetical protein